jgi:hypothetical protein
VILALSIVLVFGAVGVFLGNIMVSEQGQLGLGFEQMIHARIPWLLLAALLGGAALGVWSLVRARRWYKWVIVPVELLFAGLLTFYFTSFSFLPEHRLALSVGDAFPSYSLLDQDGNAHTVQASTARRPALYVFYRGDW